MNIVELVQKETGNIYQRKVSSGREYAGRCPFCQAGKDRFVLWPDRGRYWCRVCNNKGDAIQFVRDYKHLTFAQAQEYLGVEENCIVGYIHNNHKNDNNSTLHNNHNFNNTSPSTPQRPPKADWQEPACDFMLDCTYHLMGSRDGEKARAWLHKRTLTDATLSTYRIGYNPVDSSVKRSDWGLSPKPDDKGRGEKLWLPRGIVIPWWVDGDLWGIRIRQLVGEPRYYWVPGGTPALYNADALAVNKPVVLVEGEIDALTLFQAVGDMITIVATGSTTGARRTKWLARLATASVVLVAYDSDEAGEKAARYWLDALSNALRWRPYWADPNAMAQAGVDLLPWVLAGLAANKAA